MKVYHGSENLIKELALSKGMKNNDFGQGFYTTEDYTKACEWACKNNKPGYVYTYEIDETNLRVLNLLDGNYNVLHWIALLLKHREFNINIEIAKNIKELIIRDYLIDISKYDLVIGYRADDSYFSFAKAFINNSLALEDLSKALYLGNLGKQIVLVSEKAFNNIKYIRKERIDSVKYYESFMSIDYKAREEYEKITKNKNTVDGIYAMDIVRGNIDEKKLKKILYK